jgi:ribokinase
MWFNKKRLNFLAIGDTVSEPFINLLDAEVHCNINNEHCTISMGFGDKIPYKDMVIMHGVGNAANAAVTAQRIGLSSGLMATVGNDEEGEAIKRHLDTQGIDKTFLRTEKGVPTNYHFVLRYGAERTILIKHESYQYPLPENDLAQKMPEWIYFTNIAEAGVEFHHLLVKWLAKHPEVKLAFQPGTMQIKLGAEELRDVYAATTIFFCNKEEAQRILNKPDADFPELHAGIRALGPKQVVITDGPNGLTASEDATTIWKLPMYPDPKPPVDRTGAGDACSATIVAALELGLPFEQAVLWGPINSMSVVQYIGAQEGLLSRGKIEEYLKAAPADYKLTQLF